MELFLKASLTCKQIKWYLIKIFNMELTIFCSPSSPPPSSWSPPSSCPPPSRPPPAWPWPGSTGPGRDGWCRRWGRPPASSRWGHWGGGGRWPPPGGPPRPSRHIYAKININLKLKTIEIISAITYSINWFGGGPATGTIWGGGVGGAGALKTHYIRMKTI